VVNADESVRSASRRFFEHFAYFSDAVQTAMRRGRQSARAVMGAFWSYPDCQTDSRYPLPSRVDVHIVVDNYTARRTSAT
jgi:hypothetical protein